MNAYDPNDLYCNHKSTLSDYLNYVGGLNKNDIMFIFCFVQ